MPITAEQLSQGLLSFNRCEQFYTLPPPLRHIAISEGVAWLSNDAGHHWLVLMIAGHQERPECAEAERQVWKLLVNKDRRAVLLCETPEGAMVYSREIPYCTFELASCELWGLRRDDGVFILSLPVEVAS
jgi:hypothetical protein